MPRKPSISKSAFIRGKQCLKSLYLIKKFPELRDSISEGQQAIFNRGHRVGELAQQLFPEGVNAAFELPHGFMKSMGHTRKLIDQGQTILYEAGFMIQNTHCFVDILVKEDEQWHIYEVKSSTSISEVNYYDAAFQYQVLCNHGLQIKDVSIIHINNQYVRNGELNIHELFTIESVYQQVIDLQDEVSANLFDQRSALHQDEVPEIPIGLQCSNPYDCDFMGHCWHHIPDYSVFDISRLKAEKKFELYRNGFLLTKDVPEYFPLSDNQRLQVTADRSNQSIIDKPKIQEFLNSLEYPLYFLDFETFNPAIPLYDVSRPYQQIVFQYSLHIINNPGENPNHKEFLADTTGDPRIEMIQQLAEDIGKKGSIVVFNQGFETGRLNEIAHDFPEFDLAIQAMSTRIVDLMSPFQQKLYYTPEMKGSYSIKKVLPALVPEFSYTDLEISNGVDASISFEKMLIETRPWLISQTRKNLLAYCKLDTLAMVEILKVLERI